jgi:hypothetical protein
MTEREKASFLEWYPGAGKMKASEQDDFVAYLKLREREREQKKRAAMRRFLKVLASEGLHTVRDSREEDAS